MFQSHYIKWRNSRFEGIKKYINVELLNKKENSFLEMGCGFADNTEKFKGIFTEITDLYACDGRPQHLEKIPKNIKTFIFNCEDQRLNSIPNSKHYNIILHWGLLYHISYPNVVSHLRDVCEKCDYLFLETEVCDSNESYVLKVTENNTHYDQCLTKEGASRMSYVMIEELLTANDMCFKRIEDPILNAEYHKYNEKIGDTKTYRYGLRRYWFCWKKDKVSPLLEKKTV